jgi:hypothetical protein
MGVLTDFVVADRNDSQRVCDAACPSEEFSGLDAKGIDIVKLGTLYAVMTDTEFGPSFISVDPLATGGDEGPWVVEVPPDLVQRLAKLDARDSCSRNEVGEDGRVFAEVRQLAARSGSRSSQGLG